MTEKAKMIFGRMTILLILGFCWGLEAYAQPESTEQRGEATAPGQERWQHLETLVDTINSTREQLARGREKLGASRDDRERAELAAEVKRLSMDLESLQTAWEMMATGGIDLGQFGVRTEQSFNWRDELQSVLEPILVELRRLTERPRKIERLRADQAYYQQRLDAAETALQSIADYRNNAPSPRLKEAFVSMEERWRARRDDFRNRLALVEYELKSMLEPTRETGRDPLETLKELLTGHVFNLVLALGVMGLVYTLVQWLSNRYGKYVLSKSRRRRTHLARLGLLVFYLLTAFLVLFSGMATLYIRNDWLLLGLLLIVMAGLAWAIQRSLPRFLVEARLILNLGPVREGERIFYNGLPWKVKTLSFTVLLENPLLQGGLLHLPVRDLVNLHSRRYEETEPWFPTRVGDYVLLEDETYGKVVSQTPERVQIQMLQALKTYSVGAFLDKNPRNLSLQGFSLISTIGLDYRHQAEITTSIPALMAQALTEGIAGSGMKQHLQYCAVDFKQASSSSLDLVAICEFDGEAAGSYHLLKRTLQKLLVDSCVKHDWVIPYNQLTVHMA